MNRSAEATVLVIQGRTDQNVLREERARFETIAQEAGVQLRFVNPLNASWLLAPLYMRSAVGAIFAGSSDVNLTEVTQEARKYRAKATKLAQRILQEDFPTLGICLGHQFLNEVAGGQVEPDPKRIHGVYQVKLKNGERDRAPFQHVAKPLMMYFSHHDYVTQPGEGFEVAGFSQGDPNSVLRRGRITTMQGHPELTHANNSSERSTDNKVIVANFLRFAKDATQPTRR